mgnify:CR=1 FL=1
MIYTSDMGFEDGNEEDKLAQRIVLSPEDAKALRKAAGLPEEIQAEPTPANPAPEKPREAERVVPFEQDENPTMMIDARKVRERLAAEEKEQLLKAIREHVDELMPDKRK